MMAEFISMAGNLILDILSYIAVISLGIGVLAGMKMLWFLSDKGLEKSRFYSFNPFLFLKYIEITKQETGRYGIWVKIWGASLIAAIISEIIFLVARAMFNA